MKICMFSRISPVHSPGGMQDHVQALCAGLVRRGKCDGMPVGGERRITRVRGQRRQAAGHPRLVGEFGGLDLDEGRFDELRQAAGDFRFADAGRSHHEDVLGNDVVAQRFRELQPTPAISNRDRDGALGLILADNVPVEGGHEQRDVIILRLVSGLSIAQAAQALHKSEDAIKALQRRGLTALREVLDDWEISYV